MPVLSDIQLRLKEHEQWLIGLRQHPSMTTAKIQAELENEKSLTVTLSQLETFFRHLGQRKNLSRPEWMAVFRALDSQKVFNRHFDLYVSGKFLTEQELKKKRKNAKPPLPLAECLVDADRLLTQLPHCVTVQEQLPPGSPLGNRQPSIVPQPISLEVTRVNQDSGAIVMLDSIGADHDPLPGQAVIAHGRGMTLSPVGSVFASLSNSNQPRLSSLRFNVEEPPAIQVGSVSDDLELGDWGSIPFPSPDAWNRWTSQLSPGAFLRSPQSPASQNGFWIPGLNYASPTSFAPDYRLHNLSTVESARLLLGGSGSTIVRRGWHGSNGLSPTAEQLIDNLQSLMLTDAADGGFCGPFDVVDGTGVFTDQFIQMLLFSVVNNFAGLDGTPVELVIKFINEHQPARRRFLHHLASGPSAIYSRALTEQLLKAAITACDASTVHELLALKIVKPDDIVFVVFCVSREGERRTRRMTAIEQAAKLRQLDVVETLIHFDADVAKTYEPSWSREEKGALECAIGRWGQYRRIDIRLVELLLDNGATVNGRLLGAVIRWGDTALVEKLMSRISPSEHEYFFHEDSLSDAAEYLKNDIGYRVVRQMMQACQDTHDIACFNSKGTDIVRAISQAARRNNRDLVVLLLPHASQEGLDAALTAAARFGSHSLVRLLIAHGADVNGQPIRSELNSRFYYTTPLAEAIRHGDDELVEIFLRQGAWNHIGEPKRLEAVTCAIAESGNPTYLREALQLVPSPRPEEFAQALSIATKACHEEIALALIGAGARQQADNTGNTLLEALRNKSKSITWAILDCEISTEDLMDDNILEAAIAWGGLEIVKAIFFMGNGVNRYWGRPPLSFAIKNCKRSLIDLMINLGADLSVNPARRPSIRDRDHRVYDFHNQFAFIRDDSQSFSSPLAAAVLVRDEGITNYLLEHGADPADEQAILNALIHDRGLLDAILQTFRQRYPRGCTGFGGEALLHALKTSDEAALDLCLRAGFDVNNMTCDKDFGMVTALGFAIQKHHSPLKTIAKLLDAGGDPNLPASMELEDHPRWSGRVAARNTALLSAIETKNLLLVELLISKGAKVQNEAKLGLRRTPLQKACEVGSHSIVDLLLTHNADVNAAPAARHGATAFQLAAKTGSLSMAKKLLDLGAKVDAPGVRVGGRSAIEYAAEYGRLDMISLLFNAAGGKFGSDQCTGAIALAQENGHWACAGLLTELSTRNQAFLDASSMADGGGSANVI